MISSGSGELINTKDKITCPHCNFEIESIKPKIRLQKPKLLVVEGKDDECFFCALVESLGIDNIQVAGVGGKNQFRRQLQAIVKDDDFSKVISLGVVRDADANPAASFQSVRESLRDSGLPNPKKPLFFTQGLPRVAVMIIPSHKQKGALEDLCLEAVSEDPALTCVNQYFECLDSQDIDLPKDLSKAKIRVFLSSREDPTLPLGISAQKGYWPLDSKAFATVKGFLKSL